MKRQSLMVLSACLVLLVIFLVRECVAGEGGLRYSITVSKFENRSNGRGNGTSGMPGEPCSPTVSTRPGSLLSLAKRI